MKSKSLTIHRRDNHADLIDIRATSYFIAGFTQNKICENIVPDFLINFRKKKTMQCDATPFFPKFVNTRFNSITPSQNGKKLISLF